jgi:hypothetical protein
MRDHCPQYKDKLIFVIFWVDICPKLEDANLAETSFGGNGVLQNRSLAEGELHEDDGDADDPPPFV